MDTPSIFSGIAILVTGAGTFFAYRNSTRATAIQKRSVEGEAYEIARVMLESALSTQTRELDKVSSRLTAMERKYEGAIRRIDQLEQALSTSGGTIPPWEIAN